MTIAENAVKGVPENKPTQEAGESMLAQLGLRFTDWAERWLPDAYVFVALWFLAETLTYVPPAIPN
ncbi:MAG TPA: hypothetical protein VH684_31055 [Xanthobacteraceae bacterium]|jgi:short-chain fatty acids transporter